MTLLQHVLASAFHHPGVCFLSVALLLVALARRLPFATGYLVVFTFEIAADALVTGALSPVPAERRLPFEIAFVLLGDFRYFLLLEQFSPEGKRARALAFTLLVPLVTVGVRALFPAAMGEMRTLFLFYESAFFVFALVIRAWVLPRRRPSEREFLVDVTHFELVQYGLWAIADLLVVLGHSWALSLRLGADVLYYGAFVPFVASAMPGSPLRGSARWVGALAVAGVALSFAASIFTPRSPAVALEFRQSGRAVGTVDVASLPTETIDAIDPYYGRRKRFRAVAIEALVEKGLHRAPASLLGEDFVLRARDGYTTNLTGRRLLEGGAFVAIADLDVPDWEPIGEQRANPGPFYLVWKNPEQAKLDTHPRPWQLASIEIVVFDEAFPNVRPPKDDASERGFSTFRARCLSCHAINRSGGRVGPELNVPRNVLEYRSEADVRAYIKNPLSFRYSVMPAHPDLSAAALDDLVAYLRAMQSAKHDPDRSR